MTKPKRDPTELGRLLIAHLAKAGISQREFATRVKRPNTIINRVIYGERRPNPTWFADWSSALELDEADSAALFQAMRAARAKGKSDSADYIDEISERLEVAESAVLELWNLLKDRGIQIPQHTKKALYAIMLGKPKP